jgi:acetyl-CoA carboxylase biotin carboxyl carrier protein
MDGVKLALRRNGAQARHVTAAPAPRAAAQAAGDPPQAVPDLAAAATVGQVDVKAPMLGTFYRAPKPGAEPFVQAGMTVEPDDPIGIIEVMKLMNSIPAGLSGEVVEVLARDSEMVEYGQVLIRVRPAAP